MPKLLILLAILSFLSSCKTTKSPTNCGFMIDYDAWGATKIKIQDGKIYHSKAIDKGTITHEFDGVEVFLDGEKVSPKLLKELQKKIRELDFMSLDEESGSPEDVRYYPYTIKVNMDCKEKTVLHRSNPEYEEAPEAFQKLEEYLFEFAGRIKGN